MLSYVQLLRPKTLDEAYETFAKNKMAAFLAGGCWMRLGKRNWPAVIDLSGLNLRYIQEADSYYAIGAMSTQGDVARYEPFKHIFGGTLVRAVTSILGVQFRNCATFGGSVAAKFGFSDILPTLLAMEADVVLHKSGVMPISQYLASRERDLLIEVRIPKKDFPIAMEALRKSVSDFPILTGAMSKTETGYHIYIGTRPSIAKEAVEAGRMLTEKGKSAIDEVAILGAEELSFQSNSHASEAYRKSMAQGMIRRMAKEVL